MSRTRNSTFENFIEGASFLPWWLAVVLAIASYIIFNHLSMIEISGATGMQEISRTTHITLLKSVSSLLKYIAPVLFTLGALISAVRQWERDSDIKQQISLNSINEQEQQEQQEQSPLCPKCGDEMVIKKAKKGPNTGKDFWGCSTFPECKGIVNI